jgi:hypothetical protein
MAVSAVIRVMPTTCGNLVNLRNQTTFSEERMLAVAPIRQYQLTQKTRQEIEVPG